MAVSEDWRLAHDQVFSRSHEEALEEKIVSLPGRHEWHLQKQSQGRATMTGIEVAQGDVFPSGRGRFAGHCPGHRVVERDFD